MAVFYPNKIKCKKCGTAMQVLLAKSVNAGRSPEIRKQILQGFFHSFECLSCNEKFTIDKEFSYTDFTTDTYIRVKPVGDRYLFREALRNLDDDLSFLPPHFKSGQANVRLVFGLAELREKLVSQDYDLDDRKVELLKILIAHQHPFLFKKPRLRLNLEEISSQGMRFTATFDHEATKFGIDIPRWLIDDFFFDAARVEDWQVKSTSSKKVLYDDQQRWVNIWSLSPQPSALDLLHDFAQKIGNGENIAFQSPEFITMLNFLPQGNRLPSWAKQDIGVVFEHAHKRNESAVQDRLFEIRFAKILEDDWALNQNQHDIAILWNLLKNLPESHVEGNIKIHEIYLDQTGHGGGYYDPRDFDIHIGSGELDDPESMQDVMRHEVGHAVHEQNLSMINEWLDVQFGWKMFDVSTTGIDGWLDAMQIGNLTATERAQIHNYLALCIGNGSSWYSGNPGYVPSSHVWNSKGFGPRVAFERTGNFWYANYPSWFRKDGKAFFLNYWYRTFCVVNESTLDLIKNMPSSYASMSHFEFFAELYSLYYDVNDPLRAKIPAAIQQWLENNLTNQVAAMPAAPELKKDFEWVVRPK